MSRVEFAELDGAFNGRLESVVIDAGAVPGANMPPLLDEGSAQHAQSAGSLPNEKIAVKAPRAVASYFFLR